MKDREGHFLSPKEGKEFFQKVELWASTVSEIRQGVERIEEKVDEIGEVLNNQQTRKEPIWLNMRYPVKTFTGRESKLQEIHNKLHESTGNPMAVSRIVVISGLGGVGKSELARKYAYEYRKDYDGNVIWINAETRKDLEESFKRLARELSKRLPEDSKISAAEEGIESIIENVYRYFEDVKSLFIFDNAEGYKNISKFLPSSLNYKPYVLITSHDTKWEIGQKVAMEVIKLDVFKKPEALEFVEKFLDIDSVSQDEEIEELTEELKYFPLALKQATAYIRNKNKESKLRDSRRFEISDYLKEYQQHPEKLFKEGVYENEDCYTKTIFTTWDVTIEAIKRKEFGIEALNILEIMVYLALDDICIKETFPKSITDDKRKLWNAVKLLDRYSMINLKKKIVNIHRLVQKVIRLKLQEKGQEEETLRKALELINSNNAVKEDVSHIVSVWEHASKHGKLIDEFYFNSIYVHKVMFSKKNKESNPLHLLAENGSCKAIMAILTHVEKHHLDKLEEVINIKDNRGRTLLHIAAYNGKLDVVEYLISKGACFNVKDKLNGTPLHSAAEGGNYEVVKAVLTHIEKKHSDGLSKVVNSKTKYGNSPLHLAVYSGKVDVVEYLINKSANVDARNGYNETPLYRAVIGGNLKVVEYFVGKDTYSNVRTETGDTLLHLAIKSRRLEVVKYFVGKGIGVNVKNKYNETPLHIAAENMFAWGNLEIIKYLIEKGANVNAKGKNDETPLHLAIHRTTFSEDLSIVKCLISKGANINVKNGNNETPLHIAVGDGNLEIIKYLIEKGANVNAKGKNDETPLHLAIHKTTFSEDLSIVKCLISKGADVNVKNGNNETPLHTAVEDENLELTKYLVEKGANVNAKDKDGSTPLHFAAMKGKVDIAMVLLKHNANVNARTNWGMTVLGYAADDHQELVELLLAHGAAFY